MIASKVVLALALYLSGINYAVGFSLVQPSSRLNPAISKKTQVKPFTVINGSKEDEIAALEEQIRKLKEAETEDTKAEEQPTSELEIESATVDEPFEEMLSESWKDSAEESSDEGGVIKNIIGAVLVIVLSIAISQVPVGQEGLDKYSTAKPNQTIDLGDLNPVKNPY